MEGYLVCKRKVDVGVYDKELSEILGMHVFWVESVNKEVEKEGKFFTLEEIILTGLKSLVSDERYIG